MITDEDFAAFVHRNRALGYGRMMQIISEVWARVDPVGAQTVGPCLATVSKIIARCKREGHDASPGGEYDWCDRCGARLTKGTAARARTRRNSRASQSWVDDDRTSLADLTNEDGMEDPHAD